MAFYEVGYFPEVLVILTVAGHDIPFITVLILYLYVTFLIKNNTNLSAPHFRALIHATDLKARKCLKHF